MKNYFLLLCCTCALIASSGCASSSGVMPWGPGVYSISVDQDKTLFTSLNDAERKAYVEASEYCGAMGKDIQVSSFADGSTRWHYNAKLVFRCIPRAASEESSQDALKVEMF